MGTGASMRHMQQMNMTAAKATYTGCLKSRTSTFTVKTLKVVAASCPWSCTR
jgi:hypothetical protein